MAEKTRIPEHQEKPLFGKRKKKIENEAEFLNEIGAKSAEDIEKNPKFIKKYVKLLDRTKPEIVGKVLMSAPSLLGPTTEFIKRVTFIGGKLAENRKKRWEVLQAIAEKDILTGEQAIEAIKLIERAEAKDGVIIAISILGVLAAIVILILSTRERET